MSDERRDKLCGFLARPDGIYFSEHHLGDGEIMFRHACEFGLEGHRVEAPRCARPLQDLAQGQEPSEPGNAEAAGGGIVKRSRWSTRGGCRSIRAS